jgi:glycosyltransferase involved in cell wall biosynthesis
MRTLVQDRAGQQADHAGPPVRAWPPVSVVVPTRDRPQLLRSAVQSVIGQAYPGEVECLVVFDRQEPVPVDVPLAPRREVRLMRNDRTPGPAGAYNVGAIAARGKFLALCDDDDEWLPSKLRLQVEALERHPEALFGICGIRLSGPGSARRWTRVPSKETLALRDLLTSARNEVHSSTFIVRRDRMLRQVGLVDEAIPGSYGEDYDWILRAARLAPVVAVTRPLVTVRWEHSYFADRWETIAEALAYQLEHRPELLSEPRSRSRTYGRLAFATAALGRDREARELARRAIRMDPGDLHGYAALLVSTGLVRARTLLRLAHALGRGI